MGRWIDNHKNIITNVIQNNYKRYLHFMPIHSKGFTEAGITRLNDSIRTYVHCILGSQAQVRGKIIGNTSTSFDAQKEFLVLVEDNINKPKSIPTSIQRYQEALTNSKKKLDYVIGPNLYLLPSNMILGDIENIPGYNNNIRIATNEMKLGLNVQLNLPSSKEDVDKWVKAINQNNQNLQGTSKRKILKTVKTETPTKLDFSSPAKLDFSSPTKLDTERPTKLDTERPTKLDFSSQEENVKHENTKFFLVILFDLLILGTVILW